MHEWSSHGLYDMYSYSRYVCTCSTFAIVISCSFCFRYKLLYNTHNWTLERGIFKSLNCAMPSMVAPKWYTVHLLAHIHCTSYMSLGMYHASLWRTSTHRIITHSAVSPELFDISPLRSIWDLPLSSNNEFTPIPPTGTHQPPTFTSHDGS